MSVNYVLLATKFLGKAPDGHYPGSVFFGLYRADKPNLAGKIYFISVDAKVSKTWLSKENAVMWLREEGVVIVDGRNIRELIPDSGDTK